MGFKIKWKKLGVKAKARADGFFPMRKWQKEAFNLFEPVNLETQVPELIWAVLFLRRRRN